MNAERRNPNDGAVPPKEGAPRREGSSLTDRIRPALVDALLSTKKPFTDGFYVEPQPVVIVTTYTHKRVIRQAVSHEVLNQKTEENARHFENLEGLLKELRAQKERDD